MWHDAVVSRPESIPASEPELDVLIEELRATIEGSETLSPEDRVRLATLLRRIETTANEDTEPEPRDEQGEQEDEEEGLLEQLDDALSRFETEHVGLVSTINRIANLLSASGI